MRCSSLHLVKRIQLILLSNEIVESDDNFCDDDDDYVGVDDGYCDSDDDGVDNDDSAN